MGWSLSGGVGFTDRKLIYHLQDFRKNVVLQGHKSVTVSFLGPVCIHKNMKRKRSSDHSNGSPKHPHEDKLTYSIFQQKCLSRFIFSTILKLQDTSVKPLQKSCDQTQATLCPGTLLKWQQGHLDTSLKAVNWCELPILGADVLSPAVETITEKRGLKRPSPRAVPLWGLSPNPLPPCACHRHCCLGITSPSVTSSSSLHLERYWSSYANGQIS